jgi:long-chain acyl-CoA synthetase
MFYAGVTIAYAESLDTVAANMLEVKPTVALAVPRLYEKIYARVLENALSGGGLKRAIFFWAKRNAEAWADLVLARRPVPGGLRLKKGLADRLVFSKLRARTGGRIRFFVSGAAPLSADIAKFFYAAGMPIIEGYGLTETSPVMTVNPYEAPRLGTVGPAIPGVEVKIAADGEVLCRGPNVMKGYYNKPEANAAAIDRGWFKTGDVATRDEDGFYFIVDRKKDMIIRGGFNVYPREVEEVLYGHPAVAEAAVVGVPHERHGEEIKAVIALKPGHHATAEDIIEHCKQSLAAYKYPRVVELRDALPKGATGKILKRVLRDEAKRSSQEG